MPTTSTQELNIDDLLKEQSTKSKLKQEQVKAKKQIKPVPSLQNLPTKAANKEVSPAENRNEKDTPQDPQQKPTTENQPQKEKKIGLFQFRKRQKAVKQYKTLDGQLKKLEKKAGKYKSTNFMLLLFVSTFIDLSAFLINFFWATVILIPIALFLMVIKQMACAYIWIKIHKIDTEQKTGTPFAATLIALVVELIPFISTLPATMMRVLKSQSAAKAMFKKHEDEIKKIHAEMDKIRKQLR